MLDNYKIELTEYEMNYLYNMVKSEPHEGKQDAEKMFLEYLLRKLKV